jgi:hypothetical protein
VPSIVERGGDLTVNSTDQELLHRAGALVVGAKCSEHITCSWPAETLEQVIEVVDCQQSSRLAELADKFESMSELLAGRTCAGTQLLEVEPPHRETPRQL